MRARGEDPDANLERGMASDNAVIDGFPDVTFGIHLCRGNTAANEPPPRKGHYDAIAERLFNTLHHDRFLLEYDTERAGSFEPLRFVPRGKTVVLGLVSTKLRALESPDDLKRRIDEASKYVPIEQLALSPQCGFASRINSGPNRLSEEEQWAKLELIVKVAADVWG
jgi:5-methyltetrahydropteroyltriglutamate--homocysteine methyltransferase